MMETIFDFIKKVERHSPMYIGSRKMSDMQKVLLGYQMAVMDGECERLFTANGISWRYFNFFTAKKYHCYPSMGYAGILLEHTGNDEEKALEIFFDFVKEFTELKIIDVWELDLSEENRHYNLTEGSVPEISCDGEKPIPLYSDSEDIYKMGLNDGTVCLAVKDKHTKYLHFDFEAIFEKDIDEYIKRCFGEVKWKDFSGEISGIKLIW